MKKAKIKIMIFSVTIVIVFLLTFFLNFLAFGRFDNIFEQALGKTEDGLRGDTKGADTDYYKSAFESAEDLYKYEEELVAQIAMEGATLLENDGLLPLERGTQISLFSHSSVDLVSGGSGSGSGSFELTSDLKTGLEAAGLKVNERLWEFYKSGKGSSYKRGAGSINYGRQLDWAINECPLSVIKEEKGLSASFDGTIAMFVLSRTGGEGADLARDMKAYGGESGQHYLEPDKTELEIIDYLNKNFDDVIILVNANNVMELGWIEDYQNISAVINFPGAGRTGTYGLGYMLTGLDKDGNEISASGHLVDTIAYDSFSSPAMQNMGDYAYMYNGQESGYYYVNYAEGIYVGYKYYETRYEDKVLSQGNAGNYDYTSTVQYPFGYGLSYTEFEWLDFNVSEPVDGKITVSLKVKNIGDRAGKDVIQVYAQSPYVEGGVEKASVTLVGFEKTELLAVGQTSDVIEIVVDLKDLTSYDETCNDGSGGYVLEKGNYYITAATNAHKALNNILAAKDVDPSLLLSAGGLTEEENDGDADFVSIYTQNVTDSKTYSVGANNTPIENRFSDYSTLEDATYLSRSDWSAMDDNLLRYGTVSDIDSGAEINGKKWQSPLSAELKNQLESRNSRNPNDGKVLDTYEFGQSGEYDLIDMRGLDFDDEKWQDILNQINLDELSLLVDECGYCSPEVKSVNKPKVTDLDGPAGLNLVVGHGSVPIGVDSDGNEIKSMTWASEYMIASTWEDEFAFHMGEGIGEDGLHGGVQGWYGPAVNIHRTPFAGRNFEYYSEDAYLSGAFGYQAVNGAATKGMYAFLKHFALNDQETHRDHLGLVTWADEQTIREIYLKPFEMVIENNTVEIMYNEPIKDDNGKITGYKKKNAIVPAATGIMSSYNRIGPTWAGGNYNLLTEVLREEWGFNGFVLTDYEVSDYMFTDQCLAAGGDGKLKTVGLAGNMLFGYSLEGNEEDQYYAREAAHRILYTVVHSSAMNGFVHGVEFVNGFAYYKLILIAFDILVAVGVVVITFFIYKNVKKIRMNNDK